MSQENLLPPAEAVVLADRVEYAADSIVSKTLVKKPTGSLTLFAFDAGQGLSEHTAPFDAVVQILDGEAELTIGGQKVPSPAGSTVLMPGGVPHAVKANRKFKMLLTMIRS